MCGALASLAAHSCCCPAPGQQGDTGLITDDNCCSCNLAAMKEVPSPNIISLLEVDTFTCPRCSAASR